MAGSNTEASRQVDAWRRERLWKSLSLDLQKPGSLVKLTILGGMALGAAGGAVVLTREAIRAIDWNQLMGSLGINIPPSHETSINTVDPATLAALQELQSPTATKTATATRRPTATPRGEVTISQSTSTPATRDAELVRVSKDWQSQSLLGEFADIAGVEVLGDKLRITDWKPGAVREVGPVAVNEIGASDFLIHAEVIGQGGVEVRAASDNILYGQQETIGILIKMGRVEVTTRGVDGQFVSTNFNITAGDLNKEVNLDILRQGNQVTVFINGTQIGMANDEFSFKDGDKKSEVFILANQKEVLVSDLILSRPPQVIHELATPATAVTEAPTQNTAVGWQAPEQIRDKKWYIESGDHNGISPDGYGRNEQGDIIVRQMRLLGDFSLAESEKPDLAAKFIRSEGNIGYIDIGATQTLKITLPPYIIQHPSGRLVPVSQLEPGDYLARVIFSETMDELNWHLSDRDPNYVIKPEVVNFEKVYSVAELHGIDVFVP